MAFVFACFALVAASVCLAPPDGQSNRTTLALDLQMNPTTGWGNFGLNLLAQLALNKSMPYYPILTMQPNWRCDRVHFEQKAVLNQLVAQQGDIIAQFGSDREQANYQPNISSPVLHGVSNFDTAPWGRVWGSKNVAVCFYEQSVLPDEAVKHALEYDLILAGSDWNTAVLRAHGLENVHTIRQGVDAKLFAPDPTSTVARILQGEEGVGEGLSDRLHTHRGTGDYRGMRGELDLSGKFVVFSGGKLERRKGQDILIAAFREFCSRHTDAVLVAAWHNYWPEYMRGISAAGHVQGHPTVHKHRILFGQWMAANSIPASNFYDMGETTHEQIAKVLRRADASIFTNRAEGGTNLAAMEAMAAGSPVIISNNTGHTDIVREDHCFPLLKQTPSTAGSSGQSVGWYESEVSEVLEQLERIYADQLQAAQKAARAVEFITHEYSWPRAIQEIVDFMEAANITGGGDGVCDAPTSSGEESGSEHEGSADMYQ
jgi:glycosyltransferase involved in cell wall biosynthesis